MTTAPGTTPVPHRTIPGAAVLLLGLGAVLGVMAATFLVLGLWQHEGSLRVCGEKGASMGDCLVTHDLAMREQRLVFVGALTLGAGSATALAAAAVATFGPGRRGA